MLNQFKPLIALIGQHEGRGNYDTIWGGVKPKDYPNKALTYMTVAEVLAWQDSIDSRYRSEAAGLFQILEDTLRSNYAAFGVKLTDLFNKETQDKMALGLMRRRGLDKYLNGKITAEEFGQQISMEWASMPCTIKDKRGRAATGQSYYAGDGLNKSGVSLDTFLAAIKRIKAPTAAETIQAPSPSKGTLLADLISAFFAALAARFKKAK